MLPARPVDVAPAHFTRWSLPSTVGVGMEIAVVSERWAWSDEGPDDTNLSISPVAISAGFRSVV
jgi:hypothetical protein